MLMTDCRFPSFVYDRELLRNQMHKPPACTERILRVHLEIANTKLSVKIRHQPCCCVYSIKTIYHLKPPERERQKNEYDLIIFVL